jgi:hypothetical protein
MTVEGIRSTAKGRQFLSRLLEVYVSKTTTIPHSVREKLVISEKWTTSTHALVPSQDEPDSDFTTPKPEVKNSWAAKKK